MNSKDKKKRLNVYISESMFDYVAKKSDEMGLSMSGIIVLALYQFQQQDIMMPNIEKLLAQLEKQNND